MCGTCETGAAIETVVYVGVLDKVKKTWPARRRSNTNGPGPH